MTFSIFSTLWCTLSCYVYNRPHTSFVLTIRTLPFLKWFFKQEQEPTSSQNETVKNEIETQ